MFVVVNMGNLYVIFWVEDVEVYDLVWVGLLLEYYLIFLEGVNILLVYVFDDD